MFLLTSFSANPPKLPYQSNNKCIPDNNLAHPSHHKNKPAIENSKQQPSAESKSIQPGYYILHNTMLMLQSVPANNPNQSDSATYPSTSY